MSELSVAIERTVFAVRINILREYINPKRETPNNNGVVYDPQCPCYVEMGLAD